VQEVGQWLLTTLVDTAIALELLPGQGWPTGGLGSAKPHACLLLEEVIVLLCGACYGGSHGGTLGSGRCRLGALAGLQQLCSTLGREWALYYEPLMVRSLLCLLKDQPRDASPVLLQDALTPLLALLALCHGAPSNSVKGEEAMDVDDAPSTASSSKQPPPPSTNGPWDWDALSSRLGLAVALLLGEELDSAKPAVRVGAKVLLQHLDSEACNHLPVANTLRTSLVPRLLPRLLLPPSSKGASSSSTLSLRIAALDALSFGLHTDAAVSDKGRLFGKPLVSLDKPLMDHVAEVLEASSTLMTALHTHSDNPTAAAAANASSNANEATAPSSLAPPVLVPPQDRALGGGANGAQRDVHDVAPRPYLHDHVCKDWALHVADMLALGELPAPLQQRVYALRLVTAALYNNTTVRHIHTT
jgi:hypothetical protein